MAGGMSDSLPFRLVYELYCDVRKRLGNWGRQEFYQWWRLITRDSRKKIMRDWMRVLMTRPGTSAHDLYRNWCILRKRTHGMKDRRSFVGKWRRIVPRHRKRIKEMWRRPSRMPRAYYLYCSVVQRIGSWGRQEFQRWWKLLPDVRTQRQVSRCWWALLHEYRVRVVRAHGCRILYIDTNGTTLQF